MTFQNNITRDRSSPIIGSSFLTQLTWSDTDLLIAIILLFSATIVVFTVKRDKKEKNEKETREIINQASSFVEACGIEHTLASDAVKSAKTKRRRGELREAKQSAQLTEKIFENYKECERLGELYSIHSDTFDESVGDLVTEAEGLIAGNTSAFETVEFDSANLKKRVEKSEQKIEESRSKIKNSVSTIIYGIIFDKDKITEDSVNSFHKKAKENPKEAIKEANILISNFPKENDKKRLVIKALMPLADQHTESLIREIPEVTDFLVRQLSNGNLRLNAIEAVANIAENAPVSLENNISDISAAFGDDSEEIKLSVCESLLYIGSDEAIARLRDIRREADDYELRSEIDDMIGRAEARRQQDSAVDRTQVGINESESLIGVSLDDSERDIPEHEVLKTIGTGGNADVKKVRLTKTGEVAALKIPRWQGTISESVVEEFRTEAATWARIDDHPGIVSVFGSGTTPYPWILLEYMPDGNLQAYIDSDIEDLEEARTILVDLCEAIHHAHRHGIVHADLKPGNVLFQGATPKVGDWGLAKVLLEHSTSIEGMTPSYAAPEQLDPDQYGSVNDGTDIYQLGVIAYQMFTGELPYRRPNPAGTVTAILGDSPTPPTERNHDLPPAVNGVILKSINKHRSDRYESVLYFRDALEELEF